MRYFAAAVLSVACLGATAAQPTAPPSAMMAHVQTFFAVTESRSAVNIDTLFTNDGIVIDESAPYMWRGPHAASQWNTHIQTIFTSMSVKDFKAEAGPPIQYEQAGDGAYLILPMTLSAASAKPKAFIETGTMTFTFRNVSGDWKITSAVWTTGKNTP